MKIFYRILLILSCIAYSIGVIITTLMWIPPIYWIVTGKNQMDEWNCWFDEAILDKINEKLE